MKVPGYRLHPRSPAGSPGACVGQSPSPYLQSRGQALVSTVPGAPILIPWFLLALPTKSWEMREGERDHRPRAEQESFILFFYPTRHAGS